MNLKRIEAYGFKSFADRMVLEFKDGVTCVVGPNGCGKSNVSEAIRWALGEQTASALRCKNMQELIFNGSTGRRPMGYCEVCLVFDNSDGRYARPEEEVIIKRKLFRSGDSEYYINNRSCRLKDILELFRDTGIGKDGYSVVGQGKVDALLSAKPEDRRQVFEEAAGISKYKQRRIEAQRKLDRAYDSLLRAKDKMDVYEDQMRPLEKQAKIALRAKEVKGRLKTLDINHFIYLTEHSAKERESEQRNLNLVSQNLSAAETRSYVLEETYKNVSEEARSVDDKLKELQDKKLKLSMDLTMKSGQNKLKLQKLESCKETLERLNRETETKTAELQNAREQREKCIADQQEAAVKDVKAKIEEEECENRLKVLRDDVFMKQKEIEITNEALLKNADAMSVLSGSISKLRTEISLLEKNIEDNDAVIEQRRAEEKEAKKKIDDLTDEIKQKESEKANYKLSKEDLNRQYSDVLTRFEDSQDRRGELNATINSLKVRIEYLEESKNSYSNYDSAVRFLMRSNDAAVRDKVLGVVGGIISTPAQYSTAIEVALGGKINNMITQNQADTSFLINYLNRTRGGRGTFMPLDAMRPRPLEDQFMEALDEEGCYGLASDLVRYDRRFRPVIETLLGRVVVVDTKETAIDMVRKYRSAFRIVTLDGAHYAVNGEVSGGKREGADSRMLSVEADIAEAKRNLATDLKMLEVITADLEEFEKTLKEIEQNERVVDGIIQRVDREIAIASEKRESAIKDRDRVSGEIEKLKESNLQAKSQIEAKKALCEAENLKTENAGTERTSANDLQYRLAQELKELERQRDEANDALTTCMLNCRQIENLRKNLEKNIAAYEREIEKTQGELRELDVSIRLKQAEMRDLTEELERLAAEVENSEELEAIQKEIEETDNRKNELLAKQEQLRAEEKFIGDRVAELSAAKAKSESKLERLDSEMNSTRESIKEDYDLDYESAQEFRSEDYSDDKGTQEAKTLRKELASLGEINEKAIEDLAAIKEKYEEIKVHFDDLTRAKADLESTIDGLTKKMESNFSESFEKLKVNFGKVFAELFGGGRAMLDLDMERGMSVLDAGIIIAAEPPGKKLTNLNLLSGGERAMTALALIFAIIQLHPMPFCVLDEVDAPLDDTNANIYARYLKKFSSETQFIIISHKKPTMELADSLYGITMEEKGVSKFFVAKLSDALKLAQD